MKTIDIPYFKEKLSLVIKDLEAYVRTPADLARQLVRYARVADEQAAIDECRYSEKEINARVNSSTDDDPDYCAHSYEQNGFCPECGNTNKPASSERMEIAMLKEHLDPMESGGDDPEIERFFMKHILRRCFMTFEEWWKDQGQYFESANYLDAKRMAKSAWEAAQPKWQPIEDAPLNKRILAAMKGDEPDICKLSLSPSGILVAQLDCGSRYNAKSIYEVYMVFTKTMTFEEWAKNSKWDFDSSEHAKEIKDIAKAAWEAGREAETAGLRDKFAMAAMQGLLADSNSDVKIGVLVEAAYKYADAMLKERMK